MSEKDRPRNPSQPVTVGPTPDAAGEVDEAAEGGAEELSFGVTAVDVEAATRGLEFPAHPKDILDRARRNGADESVLQRLSELDDRRYSSLGDALRSLDMLS